MQPSTFQTDSNKRLNLNVLNTTPCHVVSVKYPTLGRNKKNDCQQKKRITKKGRKIKAIQMAPLDEVLVARKLQLINIRRILSAFQALGSP